MKKFAKVVSLPNMKLAAIRNKEVLPQYQYQSVVVDDDIKDYGTLIPGHGGIMDRFDSMMITAPIIYYLAVYFL